MKTSLLFAAISTLFVISVAGASELSENDLPDDYPVTTSLVYGLKYPMAKKLLLEAAPTFLFSDKFLNTYGAGLDASFQFSEAWAVATGFFFFSSSAIDEVSTLQAKGTAPLAYDPSFLLHASAVFYPVAGKLLLGSSVLHFKILTELGMHMAREQLLLSSGAQSGNRFGPNLGIGVLVPVNDRLSASFRLRSFLHQKLLSDEKGWRNEMAYSLGIGYRFTP
jgi:outer membrane beta-barrel protein